MERVMLNAAYGPHVHDGSSVSKIMYGYILALIPAALFGCFHYGVSGLWNLLMSVGSAVVLEYIARKLMKQPMSLHDGSAIVQGLLLGMILPASCPWWLIIVANFLVIIVAKQFFGGLGCYPLNPVMVSYAIISISWPVRVSPEAALADFPLKGLLLEPLVALKTYGPSVEHVYSLKDLLLGNQMSGLGTGAVLLLALGGLYLVLRGFIPWIVSLSYIVGIVVTSSLFQYYNPALYAGPVFHLLSGLTIMGAFFLITDFTTCPVNTVPRVLYGLMCGILIILIRNIGVYTDGTVYAILIVNLFHPLLDRIHAPLMTPESV